MLCFVADAEHVYTMEGPSERDGGPQVARALLQEILGTKELKQSINDTLELDIEWENE